MAFILATCHHGRSRPESDSPTRRACALFPIRICAAWRHSGRKTGKSICRIGPQAAFHVNKRSVGPIQSEPFHVGCPIRFGPLRLVAAKLQAPRRKWSARRYAGQSFGALKVVYSKVDSLAVRVPVLHRTLQLALSLVLFMLLANEPLRHVARRLVRSAWQRFARVLRQRIA